MGYSCEKTWFQSRWYGKSLLLANNKGTEQTSMMSKPVYLSVEIVTYKPTSGKISIPQVVSVAEQAGSTLTWSQTLYIVYLYSACWVIFCGVCYVSDRDTIVIISSSLKPYQNFRPDLSPDCLLMFSVVLPPVVIHNQRDRQFQNIPRVFYQVARVVSVIMTRENIHYIWKIVKLQIHDR